MLLSCLNNENGGIFYIRDAYCVFTNTNAFGGPFLDDFNSEYPDLCSADPNLRYCFAISETYFLSFRFSLTVLVLSVYMFRMLAWALRFSLLDLGS